MRFVIGNAKSTKWEQLAPIFVINNTIMEILSFERFKLLLEADEPAPEPPAPEAEPSSPEPAPTPEPTATPPGAESPLPFDPLAGAALPPDPNASAIMPVETSMNVVFLDPNKPWHFNYTEGGGVKRYSEYEIEQAELDKWITDSNLESQRDDILQAITGKKPIDKAVFDKIKTAAASKKLGKNRGDIDVNYDSKMTPSISKLNVIFVTHK